VSRYRVILTGPAQRELARLPEKIATAVIEFMRGVLADNPRRVGKPLDPPLAPRYVARRGEYRVIYFVHDETVEVEVVTIAHRRDAYRPR
jgi:mRNA-degrading endonuclease RelE of RelBE toxin-antitoxin system